jgi:hypothetical protein
MLFRKGDRYDLKDKLAHIINNGYDSRLLDNGSEFIKKNRNWTIQRDIFYNFISKTNILFVSHDFKFINNIVQNLENRQKFDIKFDKWDGHVEHDTRQSKELLNWADIIICEWFLGNVVWYSRYKLPHQKLFVRLHRAESLDKYFSKSKLENIDRLFFVSDSWQYQHNNVINAHMDYDLNCQLLKNDIGNQFKPQYISIQDKLSYKNKNHLHVGMIGILPMIYKCPFEALSLVKELIKKYRCRITFHLFGKSPEDLKWMKFDPKCRRDYTDYDIFIKNMSELQYVTLKDHKFVDNKNMYNTLLKLDFMFVPSSCESFHKSSLEALMAGCIPIFFGKYVTDYNCRLNWPNELCFEGLDKVVQFIDWYINNNNRYSFLEPLIMKYWNNHNTDKIVDLLVTNKKRPLKKVLVYQHFNLEVYDGSLSFLKNMLFYLSNKPVEVIVHLASVNKENLYRQNHLPVYDNVHYIVKKDNYDDTDNLLFLEDVYHFDKIFIRNSKINFDRTTNINHKIVKYVLAEESNMKPEINYISQTLHMAKKFKCREDYVLYPSCVPMVNNNKNKNKNKLIKIIYSGTLREEYISTLMLELMEQLVTKYNNVQFTLCIAKVHGNNRYQKNINNILDRCVKLNDRFIVHRSLNQNEILNMYLSFDYGFNFKQTNEDKRGQISTKVIEYISRDVMPVINKRAEEKLLFDSNYPFVLDLDSINVSELYNSMLYFKNHPVKRWLGPVYNKFSYENYCRTLDELLLTSE